jgi:hypothetical protein
MDMDIEICFSVSFYQNKYQVQQKTQYLRKTKEDWEGFTLSRLILLREYSIAIAEVPSYFLPSSGRMIFQL